MLAAARRRFGPDTELVGCDVDEATVAAARAALGPDAEIIHADALTHDWGTRQFDIVIGNPPFLNQMAAATTRGGRSRFGGGPYADAAAEFLALAGELARPDGGVVAMVVPQALLTSRDIGPIRTRLLQRAALRHTWWSPTPMFDADVRTAVLVFECGATQGPVTRTYGPTFEPREPVTLTTSWGPLLLETVGPNPFDLLDALGLLSPPDTPDTPGAPGLPGVPGVHGTLGDLATFNADFRQHYYGLVGSVGDDVDGPPLITSGLIDSGICHWGTRPVRFAKQRFVAPRVDVTSLSPTLQRWADTRLVPKLLIANQTRTIEAVIDRTGAWLPSVPVITCTPFAVDDLDRIAAVLDSPAATAWVRHHAAGSGLSADTMRINPGLLASIPLT